MNLTEIILLCTSIMLIINSIYLGYLSLKLHNIKSKKSQVQYWLNAIDKTVFKEFTHDLRYLNEARKLVDSI